MELIRKSPFNLITKKPILPTEPEIKKNPRARSAKLRIVEKK
ncbi:MAG: 16S rRNA (cytosine(1402)-N(4))-methyltransferase [Ferruginibacter sp.]